MRTALDTNILSTIWTGAPSAVTIAAQLSKVHAEGALVVSAPVVVELSAIPGLNVQLVRKAIAEMAIAIDFDLERCLAACGRTLRGLCHSPASFRRRFAKTFACGLRHRGACAVESR